MRDGGIAAFDGENGRVFFSGFHNDLMWTGGDIYKILYHSF
jgi:hypothetical protein